MHNTSNYLNVTWKFYQQNTNLLNTFKYNFPNLPDLALQILINRGIDQIDKINNILNIKLKNSVPDPYLLLDMEKATNRVIQAIENKEQVIIFGDYDVDGITSTYLLIFALRFYKLNPKFYIPNRLKDGYGLSKEFITNAKKQNVSLIIVTDSGIGAIEEVQYANSLGIDVVIFDHHTQLLDKLPDAIAVVDPNRKDQSEIPNANVKSLCAAGVVFLFVIALRRYFRTAEFPIYNLIPIAALGTIGDLVPLVGINRAIVKYCLHSNNYPDCIKKLMIILNIDHITSIEDIAYKLIPAINAAGRMGQPEMALNLFLSQTSSDAVYNSHALLSLNEKRKEIEKNLLEHVLKIIEKHKLYEKKAIFVYGNEWHEGVAGILAGKIKDQFQKPSFVVSFDANGKGRGSARSVPGLHIGELINSGVECGLVVAGGGHEQAGGLTLLKEKAQDFYDFLEKTIPDNFQPNIYIDYCLSVNSNLKDVYEKLQILEPFGTSLEKPIFAFKRVKIKQLCYVSGNMHLRLVLCDECQKGNIKCILFHCYMNSAFIDSLFDNKNCLYDVAGILTNNIQFGITFMIYDIKLSN